MRGNGAELAASVVYGGWESGGVSGSAPRPSAAVDESASTLGPGVRLSADRDTVYFPYTGGSWRLALHTKASAAVSVEGSVDGFTVAPAGSATTISVTGGVRLPGTRQGMVWLNVSEGGVNTGRITLVFDASPVHFGGMLELDGSGVCNLGRYADGELGTVEIPAGKTLTVSTPPGEPWMKADLTARGGKTVRAVIAGYSGNEQTLEGENDIEDLNALIFKDGRLTEILKNIPSSGSSYDIKVSSREGTMYVVANTGGHLNLDSLQSAGISEADWLRHPLTAGGDAPAHFFTGSVSLSQSQQTVLPVTLKRGVARFDLRLRTAGDASVKAVKFANLAQSAYLFPVDGEHSPAGVTRGTAVKEFSSPLTADTKAVMYAYEQANDGIEVTVDAVIDGKPRTLKKTLTGDLKRNTIYTITVRKEDIDVSLDITFEDWTEGGDTELTPVLRHI